FSQKMLEGEAPTPIYMHFNERIEPGHNLTIKGRFSPGVDQFAINLQNRDQRVIFLHFNPRFNKGHVSFEELD
ncbi:hypothetical protein PMAYCL1PPCAC_09644, partial [Pristionchus mayeri]